MLVLAQKLAPADLTCFLQSQEVLAKTRKSLTKAEKISAKFDVFRLKHFMFGCERIMNQSLQVETGSIHEMFAADLDLQTPDHVLLFEKLDSFRFKLPCIRRILPSLVDDHVRLYLKLPCSDAITSNFV